MPKKILLFSPPFSGHLNVLKDLVWKYKTEFDIRLIITGWKNVEPDVKGLEVPVELVCRTDLRETDPAIWTLYRVNELLADCLKSAADFCPDLILYDYFSLEGNFVGKLLNIPYWCSIPALMGPFTYQQYLKDKLNLPINTVAISNLLQKHPLVFKTEELEMISDGIHIHGQKNLIWSYPVLTPKDFLVNRRPAPYVFVGRLEKPLAERVTDENKSRPLIYFSLGTVVMDNLWNQQVEVREGLKVFINKLAELWKDQAFDVVFVNRGKSVLDKIPANWYVVSYADQISMLSRASVFVTHAGSNGFHEAVIQKVPMVAVPFFGDQLLVADQIAKLGLGIKLETDTSIDTKKPKDFLGVSLAEQVNVAVRKVLADQEEYKSRFAQLNLKAESVLELLRKILVT